MVIEGEVFAVCHIHLTKKQKIAVVYIFFVKNPTSTNFSFILLRKHMSSSCRTLQICKCKNKLIHKHNYCLTLLQFVCKA